MIKYLKNLFKEPPPSELEEKRENLAEHLLTLTYKEKHDFFEKLLDNDPELYQSWLQDPYNKSR